MDDKIVLQLPTTAFGYDKQKFKEKPNNTIDHETGVITSYPQLYRDYKRNDGLCNVSINETGCKIEFNANKIVKRKIGTSALSYEQFQDAVTTVDDYLSKEKILDCSLESAHIYRFDNSFDVVTPLNYKHYEPIFKTIATNNKLIRRGRQAYYESSIYFQNNTSGVVIYDKKKESNLAEDVVRFESRHLNNKKNEYSRLTLRKVTPDTFYQIRQKDKELINSYAFGREPQILEDELETTAYILEQILTNKEMNLNQLGQSAIAYALRVLQLRQGTPNLITGMIKCNTSEEHYRRNNRIVNLYNNFQLMRPEYIHNFYEVKHLFSEVS